MQQLFEPYCSTGPTNNWERLPRSPPFFVWQGRRGGKRLHWKRGVRWHHTVCQLCHGAKRETPWWLAEGRIAEPLYDQRVPHAALTWFDSAGQTWSQDWLMNRGIHYHACRVCCLYCWFFFFLSNKTWIILVYKKWVVVKMSFRGSCSPRW